MCELEAKKQIAIGAIRGKVSGTAIGDYASEVGLVRFIQANLPRCCACFLHNGTGFAPNQLGSAGSKTPKASESEFARPAIELAIATFHRVNAPAVPNYPI